MTSQHLETQRSNVALSCACVRAHDFSTSAHSIFLLAYDRHRSLMLLCTRQATVRTAK